MDKRAFIRGFGVGVLFTAVILGISFMVRTSDFFTKQRAVKLGMVYPGGDSKTVLSSEKQAASQTDTENKDAKKSGKSDQSKQEKKSKNEKKDSVKEEKTQEEKSSSKKTSQENDEEMKKEKEKLEKSVKSEQQRLTINAREWSTEVSRKLESMGIIDDATKFDKFLDKTGYSSSIKAGTYKVSMDDTYEDLARKITGK